MPCILRTVNADWTVLCGVRHGIYILKDPFRGELKMTAAEIAGFYEGTCLTVAPGPAFRREGRRKNFFSRISPYLIRPGIPLLLLALSCAMVNAAKLALPLASQTLVDQILPAKNMALLDRMIPLVVFLVILEAIAMTVSTYLTVKMSGRYAIKANAGFFMHLLHMPLAFFTERDSGDLESRQGDNKIIADVMIGKLIPVLLNILLLLLYTIILAQYSLPLTLVSLVSLLLSAAAAVQMSRKANSAICVARRTNQLLNGCTVMGVSMIDTIRSSGAENSFFEMWSDLHDTVTRSLQKGVRLSNLYCAVPQLCLNISNAITLFLGAMLILNGHIGIGALTAFQGILQSLQLPITGLLQDTQSFLKLSPSMESVEDVLARKTEFEQEPVSGTENYDKLHGSIELSDITFGYEAGREAQLRNIQLTIPAGGFVAVVGSSGCGKSTLASVISGLYKPWSGKVTIDGKDLQEIPRSIRAASIAVVDQEIHLFSDSVRQNIRLWDGTMENYEMVLAARDACIHDDILHMQGAYNAELAENGKNLSGGQRQRIEIAHALAKEPTILILDEATAALDAITEKNVLHAIRERGITCILVAHRVSAIRDCDTIYVMQEGRITASGTHDELMKCDPFYQQLVSME
jgi:ABC-type bacteriocin/lantibiotic exporter with double-glycine peptidase domain